MATIEERYISLLTDFGFKRIFGTAPNKDLLINFLNSLFAGKQVVKDVRYLNTEHRTSSRTAHCFIPRSPSASRQRKAPTGISSSHAYILWHC